MLTLHSTANSDCARDQVVRFCHDERRCWLDIVAVLLRSAADDSSRLRGVADEAVDALLDAGLIDTIIRQCVH